MDNTKVELKRFFNLWQHEKCLKLYITPSFNMYRQLRLFLGLH